MLPALSLRRILESLVQPSATIDSVLASPSSCNDRSISDIIWSCLSTIFVCTWIAIHPNIPQYGERSIFRRLVTFLLALIAPELVVLWALRQWLTSRKLARRYKDFGWTQTHGFFAIMGGFQVRHSNGDFEPFILDPDDVYPYLENHDITISLPDIQDRSKGDTLAKSLVLLQASWFMLSSAARVVQRLTITELELVTMAFAILNFMTYFCWWNKPLNVMYPMKVVVDGQSSHHTGPSATSHPPSNDGATLTAATDFFDSGSISVGRRSSDNTNGATTRPLSMEAGDIQNGCITRSHHQPATTSQTTSLGSHLQNPKIEVTTSHSRYLRAQRLFKTRLHFMPGFATKDAVALPIQSAHDKYLPRFQGCRRWCSTIYASSHSVFKYTAQLSLKVLSLLCWPITTLLNYFRILADFTGREFSRLVIQSNHNREYPFGILSDTENAIADIFTCGVSVVFGAIHSLAWNFQFPTPIEKRLWRTSSIMITCLPIYVILLSRIMIHVFPEFLSSQWRASQHPTSVQELGRIKWLMSHLYFPLFRSSKFAYLAARMVLLVEMFLLLRKPSPGTYTSVRWAAYVPHL